MALRKWVFDRTRKNEFPVVVLDGGDFVPLPDDSLHDELAAFLIEGMVPMEYDAVGVGELELGIGVEYLETAASRLPLVCANLKLPANTTLDIPEVRWVLADGRRIAITGYVDPLLYYELPGALDQSDILVLDPVETLTSLLTDLEDEADKIIVLAHAPEEQIRDFLKRVKGIDVLVQGHDPGGARGLGRIEETYFVNPAKRSREVSFLTLVMDPEGVVERAGFRTWILSQVTRGDRELERMVRKFQRAHGIE